MGARHGPQARRKLSSLKGTTATDPQATDPLVTTVPEEARTGSEASEVDDQGEAAANSGPRRGSSRGSTARTRERAKEEAQYVPVIIKRADQVLRHPDDILQTAIAEGIEQYRRPVFSLALSAVAGGLLLGFSAMAVAVVETALQGSVQPRLLRLITPLVYPLGFVVCMMSRCELFTEHTATAVYPVLDGHVGLPGLARVWTVVALGNLAGAAIAAVLLSWAEPVINARPGYMSLAQHLVAYPSTALLVSAVLAGWLMALGAWLVLATPPRVSQVVLIYLVTFLIGLGGLHHSIAGSVELFAALLAADVISLAESARFLLLALGGNLLGGSVFVAVLNYGHIRQSQIVQDDE